MRSAKEIALRLLTGILICLPPAAVLRIILKYGQSIPWWDQWGIPGKILLSYQRGTLSPSDFFQPHNESVKAFTGLVWFLLALPAGWSPRTEMVVTWLVTVALAVILFFLLRRTLDGSRFIRHAIFALTVLCLFHPYGTKHWLIGLNLENALVIFFLSAGLLVNGSSAPTWTKYLLTAGFSLAATFSYANGMVLWVLICPALPSLSSVRRTPSRGIRRVIPGLLYLAAALICIFVFLSVSTENVDQRSMKNLEFDKPLAAFIFLLHWLGAPFQLPGLSFAAPGIASVFLLLFFLSILFIVRRRKRGEDCARIQPWLLMALYPLVTGTAVACGRLSDGPGKALADRYFLHVVVLPIALLPLAALLLRNESLSGASRRFSRVLRFTLVGLMVLTCTVSVLSQWPGAESTARIHANTLMCGARALSFINAVPDNPNLNILYPGTAKLKMRARILRNGGILDFPLHPPIPRAASRPKEIRIEGMRIHLELQDGNLRVSGVCSDSHSVDAISHLLLTSIRENQREQGFSIIPLAASRVQSGLRFRARVNVAGLEQGHHLVKAWVYDDSTLEYSPLAFEWALHYDKDGLFLFPTASPHVAEGPEERQRFEEAGRTIQRLEQQELATQITPIRGVTIEEGKLRVEGFDPSLLLPQFTCAANASALIHLQIKASHATFVQMFYRNDLTEQFTERSSIWTKVRAGDNNLYISATGPGPQGRWRLDPGNRDGVFELQLLEVREYPGSQ